MSGKAVRETLAALGVIASLVFVGAEIRQNTAVARGQTRQELATMSAEWLTLHAADAEVHDIWLRAWVEEGTLTDRENSRATYLMTLNLRRLENIFLQYSEGLLDESALNSYGFQQAFYYPTDRFREWWTERRRGSYDPDFVRFFEERMGVASQ